MSTDALMTPILDTLPGYREAADSLAALKNVPMPVTRGALTPADQLADDIVAQIAAGKPLNLLADAATAIAEVEAVRVARAGLTQARERLEGSMRELRASNPDHVLSGLHGALSDLVAEVTALQPLHEITTEAGAIASDRTKDFKRLHGALAPRYDQIRTEQIRLMNDVTGGDPALPEVWFCRNLPALFPLWPAWRSHGHLIHDQRNRVRDIRPPWPVPGDAGLSRGETSISRTTFTKDARRADFMLWAIEAGAQLWVPTLPEYAEAAAEHHSALSREHRTGVIDEHWLDPGGIDVGAPSRAPGKNLEHARVGHAIRMAQR